MCGNLPLTLTSGANPQRIKRFFLILNIYLFLFHVYVCVPAFVYHIHAVPTKARRGRQFSLVPELQVAVLLGSYLDFLPPRAASVLNC